MANWVVVLTGGIGSGKSLVAGLFEDKGIEIVEQDNLSREIVEPGQPALKQIEERFGATILNDDGSLNRSALREEIFADAEHRIWLNRLTHPLINELTRIRVEQAESPYVMVVNPLLGARAELYDRYLVVDVPVETQISRTMERDGISRTLAQDMVKSQLGRESRLRLADDVIWNDGTKNDAASTVANLHRRYLLMALP